MSDGSISWTHQVELIINRSQPRLQSPGEELAEAGVGGQRSLSLLHQAASLGCVHPDDEVLQWLGEVGGGEPAPASRQRGQGKMRVDVESEAGGDWDHRDWCGDWCWSI